MKTFFTIAVILSMLASDRLFASTYGIPTRLTDTQLDLIKKNVLVNLENSAVEVRADAIQLLIDLRKNFPNADLDFAILPLLNRLKSDDREEIRILSAIALYNFDSELGRFAVERRALYDSSQRVSKQCLNIAHVWNHSTTMPAATAALTEN